MPLDKVCRGNPTTCIICKDMVKNTTASLLTSPISPPRHLSIPSSLRLLFSSLSLPLPSSLWLSITCINSKINIPITIQLPRLVHWNLPSSLPSLSSSLREMSNADFLFWRRRPIPKRRSTVMTNTCMATTACTISSGNLLNMYVKTMS